MAFNFAAGFNIKPCGLQQISAATLATAQTLTAPTGADRVTVAMIQAEGGACKWTDDGSTTPTATVGMLLSSGETLPYQGDLSKFQIIRKDATATLNISYYRAGEGGE